jgi:hypothetical protein
VGWVNLLLLGESGFLKATSTLFLKKAQRGLTL